MIASSRLPKEFDGYTILHLSDLHTDISEAITERVARLVTDCEYDMCVMTGDYRARTSGSHDAALAGMARICEALRGSLYGVLGNHDSATMVPALEAPGIRLLMNERVAIGRDDARIQLAGVDDAHFFRMDNVEKVATEMPESEFSILLSHTPEIYRQAAHAGFDVMLSGHTHGGQICLPGGIGGDIRRQCLEHVSDLSGADPSYQLGEDDFDRVRHVLLHRIVAERGVRRSRKRSKVHRRSSARAGRQCS